MKTSVQRAKSQKGEVSSSSAKPKSDAMDGSRFRWHPGFGETMVDDSTVVRATTKTTTTTMNGAQAMKTGPSQKLSLHLTMILTEIFNVEYQLKFVDCILKCIQAVFALILCSVSKAVVS